MFSKVKIPIFNKSIGRTSCHCLIPRETEIIEDFRALSIHVGLNKLALWLF